MNRARCLAASALLILWAGAASAADRLDLDGPVEQGALVRGATEPGARVTLDGAPVRVAPDGRFILGFGRDAPGHAALDVVFPDGRTIHRDLEVAPREYAVQRIYGLPPAMVTPDPEVLARIRRDIAAVKAARDTDSDQLAFETPLRWPAEGPITGIYGTQRILNGEPRQPHFGIDVAAPKGSPVVAAAAGTVTLAEPDLYFTGGTIIIDHGYGLSTTYMHMATVEVMAGQKVAQGERIGSVGATGRVTGPHLDWRVNWYQVRLDPQLVAGPMPKPAE